MAAKIPPRRVLLVRPSALGDVCRTVPVLVSVKAAYPEARIDWVVRDAFRATIEAHPDLNEAIAFPRARFARWWRSPGVAIELSRWLGAIRRRRYDLVIDCQGLGRSALITRFTGAPRRVGPRPAREFAWLGYNVRHPVGGSAHTVDAMLELVRGEGIEPVQDMRLYVADDDRAWWARTRDELGVTGRYAVLAPTARWITKRWPIDRWRALTGDLVDRGFDRIVVIGAPDEMTQVQDIVPDNADAAARTVNLVGRAGIGGTMAVIAEAGLVVANDSAPLHMAIGFDRPCVALFGPTDPERVGPYRRPEAVVRGYIPGDGPPVNYRDASRGDALMQLITVEDVLERIDAVMTGPGPRDARERASIER